MMTATPVAASLVSFCVHSPEAKERSIAGLRYVVKAKAQATSSVLDENKFFINLDDLLESRLI